jgi:hypothetical protein
MITGLKLFKNISKAFKTPIITNIFVKFEAQSAFYKYILLAKKLIMPNLPLESLDLFQEQSY